MKTIEKVKGEIPFTMIPNATIRDTSIGLGAHFLHSWVMSYPDGWRCSCAALAKATGKSRSTVHNWMNELVEAGYVERSIPRNYDGTFGETVYLVHNRTSPKIMDTADQSQDSGSGSVEPTSPNFTRRGKNGHNKEGLKEKEGVRVTKKEFETGSWQLDFAIGFALRLIDNDILQEQPPNKTLQKWADVFDKINRLDKRPVDEIQDVCGWLLREDNWWMQHKAIGTALKLRSKHERNDCSYYETIRRQHLGEIAGKNNGKSRFATAFSREAIQSIAADTAAYHARRAD